MRTVKLTTLPKCNFCSKEAVYDAPVNGRSSWANACEGCSHQLNLSSGTKLEKKVPVDSAINEGKVVDAVEEITEEYLEGLLFGEFREVECPECGAGVTVYEVDADMYHCDCGVGLKLKDICAGCF